MGEIAGTAPAVVVDLGGRRVGVVPAASGFVELLMPIIDMNQLIR
jgi:hypothetical protein